MSFRLRLTMLAAVAVAVGIVGASFAVYYADRHELLHQVDSDLLESQAVPPLQAVVGSSQVLRAKHAVGFAEGGKVVSGGTVGTSSAPQLKGNFRLFLPKSSTTVQVHVRRVGAGSGSKPSSRFSTQTVNGVSARVLTLALPNETISVARSLLEVDRNLSRLRLLLVFICFGGIGAATLLGALVSGRAVAPLRRLTDTTERIVATGDLSQRTGQVGRDEISRLSARLDELLASLQLSLDTQRQLVADASHELRTPIATLRANFELLASPGTLDDRERAELLADVSGELEAMTTLVAELVELARGEELDAAPRDFRLDEVVQAAVERATRRSGDVSFHTDLEPSTVTGVPERVECAVANLLDNARKWSPAQGTVEVAVRSGRVEVRDRGPGIADEDVPLVFNRFYRSSTARGMPGAGLGLAIVKQIADAHGGSVSVERGTGGGTILRLQLSATP